MTPKDKGAIRHVVAILIAVAALWGYLSYRQQAYRNSTDESIRKQLDDTLLINHSQLQEEELPGDTTHPQSSILPEHDYYITDRWGALWSSPDGFNWTKRASPVPDSLDYRIAHMPTPLACDCGHNMKPDIANLSMDSLMREPDSVIERDGNHHLYYTIHGRRFDIDSLIDKVYGNSLPEVIKRRAKP